MIDLQLHTTDSDGTWPWDKVLSSCLDMGLKAFSITDHDTVVRQAEIKAWAKKYKSMAIPGVELSTKEGGQTVHLLGYFLEGPLEKLENALKFLRLARFERNRKIIKRLQQLGYAVTEEELMSLAGNATVGRPHIARLLLQKGLIGSIKEGFDKFLALGAQAYFPKDEIPLQEGINLLHGAGAVASVAHPILLNRPWDILEASIKTWASWGLDGIEGIYPVYQPEQTVFLNRMSMKYNLLTTGGSDFHGENKPHIKIGVGLGQMNVPDALLAPLLKRKDEILKSLTGC